MLDLASQMKYLTDASPQLKRNSKVLSWIESGDFEDTGIGLREAANCKAAIYIGSTCHPNLLDICNKLEW